MVLGDPINCRNLLEDDQAILVFPEGARGSGKIYQQRYRLAPFGRGFMRLALQTKTPVVPVAVIGAEESIISIHDWKGLAKLLRAPYVPISPLLPHCCGKREACWWKFMASMMIVVCSMPKGTACCSIYLVRLIQRLSLTRIKAG